MNSTAHEEWLPGFASEAVLFCHEVFCREGQAYTEIKRVQPNAAAVRAFLGY